MEIHSVLPEERARDEKGEQLPWGYRYADSSRNLRQPEESGPFGRNRSLRHTNSRASRTRTGTTPVRQKENTAVAEFGRLFAKEQAKDEDEKSKRIHLSAATNPSDIPVKQVESVATECLLYGYASKNSEWKVLSKYEKIAAPSVICEDYPRDDPNLLMSNSPSHFSGSVVLAPRDISRDALKKSRVYRGGQHWIKITFDSYQGAERACFFSPIEIDGCMVHCEMWQGKPPATDLPIPKGTDSKRKEISRTVSATQTARLAKDSAVAGFERVMQTLPRSHTVPDTQYRRPPEDVSVTSTTASSATATEAPTLIAGLRSRSTPHLPSQLAQDPSSQYMTHIPSIKRVVLRPISEALPPQPTVTERILRSLPIISWFVGRKGASGDLIGEGPLLGEDGNWDEKNGWYWSFWHSIDRILGTDFCGLRDD